MGMPALTSAARRAEDFDRRPASQHGSKPVHGAPLAAGRRAGPHSRRAPVEGATTAEVVIDNGAFGVHKIRFETGRLARLAGGFAVVYLGDETMVLAAP